MGHFEVTIVGEGMTQEEAFRDAASKGPEKLGYHESSCSFREVLSCRLLSVPKKGQPTVRRFPSSMRPKWARRWIVKWQEWKNDFYREHEKPFKKKSEAVDWAKEQVKKNGEGSFYIKPGYVLISGNPDCVEVHTISKYLGRWEFVMDFHH